MNNFDEEQNMLHAEFMNKTSNIFWKKKQILKGQRNRFIDWNSMKVIFEFIENPQMTSKLMNSILTWKAPE